MSERTKERLATVIRDLKTTLAQLSIQPEEEYQPELMGIKRIKRQLDVAERLLEEVSSEEKKGEGFREFLGGIAGREKQNSDL